MLLKDAEASKCREGDQDSLPRSAETYVSNFSIKHKPPRHHSANCVIQQALPGYAERPGSCYSMVIANPDPVVEVKLQFNRKTVGDVRDSMPDPCVVVLEMLVRQLIRFYWSGNPPP